MHSIDESGTVWIFEETQTDELLQIEISQVDEYILEFKITSQFDLPDDYIFSQALCNLDGVNNLVLLGVDNFGGFDNANPTDVNYRPLSEFDLPQSWCEGTDGLGYIIGASMTENVLPLHFRLVLPPSSKEFNLYTGTGTSIVQAKATTIATRRNSNENIVRDSTGILHSAFISSGNDLWYANSSDNGLTWTSKELIDIPEASAIETGVLVDTVNNLFIYYTQKNIPSSSASDSIKMFNSTDGGSTFEGPFIVFEDGGDFAHPSCTVDNADQINCCAILNDDHLYFANSQAWNTKIPVNINSTDGSNQCDIESDSNNTIYIVASGDDQNDVDLWTSEIGWGSKFRIEIDNPSVSTPFPTIAIDNDDNIYLAYTGDHNLKFANSSKDHVQTFSVQELDPDNSYLPDIAVSSQQVIYILYSNKTILQNSTSIFASSSINHGVNWTIRNLLANGNYPSIADTHYANSNRMRETLRYVYTNFSKFVLFDSFNITYGSCYPEPGENWDIDVADNCINSKERDLEHFNLSARGVGSFLTTKNIKDIFNWNIFLGGDIICRDGCFQGSN